MPVERACVLSTKPLRAAGVEHRHGTMDRSSSGGVEHIVHSEPQIRHGCSIACSIPSVKLASTVGSLVVEVACEVAVQFNRPRNVVGC